MNADLVRRRDKYGLFNFSTWQGTERPSMNTILFIYYFRDIDGLNKFAHDPVHRKARGWYEKGNTRHIGIFHETFYTPSKAYESVYGNMHPVLMGTSDMECFDEETGKSVWVSPLVDATVGPLRSQFSRMGRTVEQEIST
jgi:fumagillin biosynthesis monooxygenase